MKYLVTICLVICSVNLFSQKVKFIDKDLNEVLNQASEESLIFIQIVGARCPLCDKTVVEALNSEYSQASFENTVFIKMHKQNPVTKDILRRYKLGLGVLSLIINKQGEYLAHLWGSSRNPKPYIDLYNKALENKDSPPFREFYERYLYGERTKGFLKEYIQKLESYRLNNEEIVNAYASQLSFKDTDNYDEMFYLFERGPTVNSLAFRVLYFNKNLKNEIYDRNQSNKVAHRVNNLIINKSRTKAILSGDEKYMHEVARFARNTWSGDYERGRKSFDSNMSMFYFETGDEENFNDYIKRRYNLYYINLDPDSMRVVQLGQNPLRMRLNTYGDILNKMAWETYLLSDDPESLALALEMSEKSIQFYKDPALLDTKAHILYKLGSKEEAIKFQEEAIDMLKMMGLPEIPSNFIESLEKMKNGTLLSE